MKFLQVNYDRSLPADDPNLAAVNDQAAQHIAQVPGLLWKLWVYNEAEGTAGGMYLFESEETARAWEDGPLIPSLSTVPGVSNITTTLFDVDEARSRVTRAPIGDAE